MSVVSTMLLRMLDENGSVPYLSPLLCALLGRGPIPQSLVTRALSLSVPLVPTYGLTEAASQVASAALGDAEVRPGSCGWPAPRGPCSASTRSTSEGPAEILVKGRTLMAGHFRREEASAAAVCGGWLHTVDIGHFDAEGFFYVDDGRHGSDCDRRRER
jgi:O-succinylbenzoic acid--CoA ligase